VRSLGTVAAVRGKRDTAVPWDVAAGAEPATASESALSAHRKELGVAPQMLIAPAEQVSDDLGTRV
jgi:hypothetical protein